MLKVFVLQFFLPFIPFFSLSEFVEDILITWAVSLFIERIRVAVFLLQILENCESRRTGDISASFRPKFDGYTSQNYHTLKNK